MQTARPRLVRSAGHACAVRTGAARVLGRATDGARSGPHPDTCHRRGTWPHEQGVRSPCADAGRRGQEVNTPVCIRHEHLSCRFLAHRAPAGPAASGPGGPCRLPSTVLSVWGGSSEDGLDQTPTAIAPCKEKSRSRGLASARLPSFWNSGH